ncbi:MAG TPA: phage major capsid protein [Gemmatimonadaceae bacterium]|jgi:HK97 family phage major capsid protein|nr:phage major capsid protein [Gemmatimonadaceae bacterium]
MNITQLAVNLRAKQAEIKALLETQMRACEAHVAAAATATTPEVKGRLRTDEEKAAVQVLLDEGKSLKARIDSAAGDANMLDEIERLTAGMVERPAQGTGQAAARSTRSMGEQFVNDPGFRAFIKSGGHQVQQGVMFTSPAVDLQATLVDTSGGSGGPLIVPDYRPGVIMLGLRRLVVADLIAPGSTDSNAIIYMKELAETNAAAAVAEGTAKPESALSFVQATDPVTKIATWIPVTTEMLEDFSAMQSLVDARLKMFLSLAEEDQLLNGSGVAPNMRGINNRLALAAAVARGADSNMDALMKQISAIATNALIQPDGFVMNPANWLTIQLAKNANGNYMGSGPWAGPQPAQLWGLPGAITPAEPAGTSLVGAFATCAQFFRKGGVKAAMSNSHLDFFTTNKVAMLVEERGALCVYREAAFGKVTGLL